MQTKVNPTRVRNGRQAENLLRAQDLADVLRRLIRLSVSTAPSASETAALTEQLTAVADRMEWEARILFLAREPLLLRGGNDPAIAHQRHCVADGEVPGTVCPQAPR